MKLLPLYPKLKLQFKDLTFGGSQSKYVSQRIINSLIRSN